jgi:uncharacterized membrane protein YvlD (DUF360 family)
MLVMLSLLIRIVLYAVLLWVIESHAPQLGFSVQGSGPGGYAGALIIAGILVWLAERVLKKILSVVMIPLNIVTL